MLCSATAALHAAPDPALAPTQDRTTHKPPSKSITAEGILKHVKVLASDEYEGRAPGSKGEELSVEYISGQYKALGLKPGNPDGTYVQEVPLAGITSSPTAAFTINGQTTTLKYPDEFVASSEQLKSEINVDDSDVVFVGYGVVAPEYGWDDYKDVDVSGKTLLMLINDPAIPDPKDPTKLDDSMFKGKAMTYYGRWTYKYEIAAKKGAKAAVIIHETGPAAYQYSVVRMSWAKENFAIDAPDKNAGAVPVRSWITVDVAKKLIADSGHDFETLKKAALSKDFRPMELGIKANIDVKQAVRPFKSRNVVAALPGSNPALKDEWIIYSAHWDHLGKHPELKGDQIFNGAVDNASGVGALLAIAKAYTEAKPGPERSILFMGTTAEEAGLLGAKYYAEHPLYPLAKTLADINMDVVNVHGRRRTWRMSPSATARWMTCWPKTPSARAARSRSTAAPKMAGFTARTSSSFPRWVCLRCTSPPGRDLIGQPPGTGDQLETEYILKRYHKPADEVTPDWDLAGGAQDMQLLFEVGWEVANGDRFPDVETRHRVQGEARRDDAREVVGKRKFSHGLNAD